MLNARKELCVFNVMCAILTAGGLEVADVSNIAGIVFEGCVDNGVS